MADDRMFEPLPGAGGSVAAPKAGAGGESWAPILPVPADAPAPPKAHPKHGKPSRRETYRDAAGAVLGYVLRIDGRDGEKAFYPLTFCREGASGRRQWRWKGFPVPRPLYGLDRLAARPDALVIVTEGEKAADAAGELLPDFVVVTAPGGAKSAGKADWSPLKGRRVTVWPDDDAAGREFAAKVAECLSGLATELRTITPPKGVAVGWDAADARAEGWDTPKAAKLLDGARAPASDDPGTERHGEDRGADSRGGRRRPSQSAGLVELVDDVELWHSADRDAFASVPVADHVEHWPLRSKGFRLWLINRYYRTVGAAPGAQAFEDALRMLEAMADEGPEHPTWLRVAEYAGAIYLDLANERWQAVRVTGKGWAVVDRAPVKFLRSRAMRPLPVPEAGGSLDDLRDLVNVRSDDDFRLLVAFLLGALRPRGPYPILVVNGEQGSGKSCLSRMVRALIDPNEAPIRSAPKDEQGLIIAARNSWTITLDNLSELPGWLSDSLCRLATGGGFSARALYTNWEEEVYSAQRPAIINGIPDLASRADLTDRCIHLVLASLPDGERRSEQEIEAQFAEERPFILGALLEALAGAVGRSHETQLAGRSTRMADFANWITAAEPALGWAEGDFLRVYGANREGSVETAIEQDLIAPALRKLVDEQDWEGTASELLTELECRVTEKERNSRYWPHVNKLKGRLRRIQAPLRSVGIVMDLEQRAPGSDRTRLISIRKPARGLA